MRTDACIASPHWGACETCKHNKWSGCDLGSSDINMTLYLGDFILCDDYEPNTPGEPQIKGV